MIGLIDSHAIEGPSVYSHRPVIKLTLDLGPYANRNTCQLNQFNEKLLQALPSLRSHYCSRGYPGGFLERLEEGTFLGHVVEHLILELLNLCGMKSGYGKTITGPGPGQAEVIFESNSYSPSVYVAQFAIAFINELLQGKIPTLDGFQGRVDRIRQLYEPGPSTEAIINEARRRHIPVSILEEGSSLLLLGYGALQKRVRATLTSDTGCLAADLAGDKALAKKLLYRAGIPTPRGEVVTNHCEAVQAATRLGCPVVIKPCDANQGKGVSLNLNNPDEIVEAFNLASRYSSRVLVEEYITGRHYRILVVEGRMVAAARRLPAKVTGNGSQNVAELIELVNRDWQRGVGHARSLTRISPDEELIATLSRKGIGLDYCPRNGEKVILRENSNLSTGGTAWDVTFKVHPANADLAERAAAVLGLNPAGIDLVSPDLGKPLEDSGGAVIEVNAAPGIRMHLYPSRGRGNNVASAIVSGLFPGNSNGRIPIVSITGTNGKTTTARLLAHIWRQTGKTVGLASTGGVYIGDKQVYRGDTTGPRSARMVLDDPAVEVAILETARGGIIRAGLGYDRSDLSIVTNISEDHFGQDRINSIEDLVFVKSLLVEAVNPGGTVVLNGDDPNVLKMMPRASVPVTLFSQKEDNLFFIRHIGSGGKGLTVRHGWLFWSADNRFQRLIPVDRIPLTFNGLARHNLENAMAAAAAALSMKLPRALVARGLENFAPTAEHIPGRVNLYHLKDGDVLLDYGHNPAAMAATLQFASKLGYRRMAGVIGVPADRSDELIARCGERCAPYLDRVIFKEDRDLRGRQPGQTARLLKEGFMRLNPSPSYMHVVLDELEAVKLALKDLRKGDLLIIFYEEREPIHQVVEHLAAQTLRKKESEEKGSEESEENLLDKRRQNRSLTFPLTGEQRGSKEMMAE